MRIGMMRQRDHRGAGPAGSGAHRGDAGFGVQSVVTRRCRSQRGNAPHPAARIGAGSPTAGASAALCGGGADEVRNEVNEMIPSGSR